MKFTWNWLSEFIEIEQPPATVAERLTMAGLEVDGIEELGQGLDHILCAEVLGVEPHPHADRLQLCTVRSGNAGTLTVVCGAPNVAVGQRVPLALPGAVLPGGLEVKPTEIRGVASSGMLCSAAEIGIGEDGDGLLVLPADAKVGAPIAEVLGLADVVLELSITPNRGDCLSVLGIAREIVALTGAAWRVPPALAGAPIGDGDGPIAIAIDEPDLCRRYVGQVFDGVRIAPSPTWMQNRLRAVGLRPINNVVDVTNYVMLERGQPLHAFDAERLPEPEIRVKRAGASLRFTTLDDVDRQLEADDLLITSGGEPVALAGVMGGANSEVTTTTRCILLESAWFRPESVRRTAKRLGLRSEASYRFERGVDLEGVAAAAARAGELLIQLAGARAVGKACDANPRPHVPAIIPLRLPRLEAMLGVVCEPGDVIQRLRSFGFAADVAASDGISVVAPAFRSDVTREIDVIEEVARSFGYENVPSTLPQCELGGGGQSAVAAKQRELRRLLAGLGFDEVVALSFASPENNRSFPGLVPGRTPVRVLNPLTQEDSELRLSLLPGLLQALATNLAQGAGDFAGFALGKGFWQEGVEYREARSVAGIVCDEIVESGLAARRGAWDFADVKGVVEAVLDRFALPGVVWCAERQRAGMHPGKSAVLQSGGVDLGFVGCLHPEWAEERSLPDPVWLFELDLESLLDYLPGPSVFEELPRFPVVVRDLALVADTGFESGQVVRCVHEWAGDEGLVESVRLTDRYVGPPLAKGKESLTYTVAYRSRMRTLTDREVNEAHDGLVAAVRGTLPVELR